MTTVPEPHKKAWMPFAKQAARASWVAPICVAVLDGATHGVRMDYSNPWRGPIVLGVAVLALVLLVFGLTMGILALFGVKRHGREGILAPAVVGICLNGGILALNVLGEALILWLESRHR